MLWSRSALRAPGFAVVVLAAPVSPMQGPASILGTWVGESRCVGDHPSCHPEHVIYQVDSAGAAIVVRGARTAGVDTVQMGSLECRRQASPAEVTCSIGSGVWRFWVAQDSLRGSLTLTDGSVMRAVVAGRRLTTR